MTRVPKKRLELSPSNHGITALQLRVDRALDRVSRMRRKYPPQLTQFLDKALLHQADAAKVGGTNCAGWLAYNVQTQLQ